jgi:hypothetical protein
MTWDFPANGTPPSTSVRAAMSTAYILRRSGSRRAAPLRLDADRHRRNPRPRPGPALRADGTAAELGNDLEFLEQQSAGFIGWPQAADAALAFQGRLGEPAVGAAKGLSVDLRAMRRLVPGRWAE